MRIHTWVNGVRVADSARLAGARLERMDRHGSRKAAHAWDVILTGDSSHNCHWSRSGDYRAATWDQWGAFLAAIYRTDPAAICGTAYVNAEHFHWATIDRYATARAADQAVASRCQHRWDYVGTCATGAYSVAQCRKCTAGKRWLVNGHTWADISDDHTPPAPARRTTAEIAADVAALRAELDGDPWSNYRRPSEPEYGHLQAPDMASAGPGGIIDVPAALPWSPSRRRDVVSA